MTSASLNLSVWVKLAWLALAVAASASASALALREASLASSSGALNGLAKLGGAAFGVGSAAPLILFFSDGVGLLRPGGGSIGVGVGSHEDDACDEWYCCFKACI